MQVIEWPNGLGFDVEEAEVWKHKDKFRVFTPDRVLLVPYFVTTDPLTAVTLCEEQGLYRDDLEKMDPRHAQMLFESTMPVQRELF